MKFNITVTRAAGIRRDELHELDADLAGVYPIEAIDEDAALDDFHSTVAIKVLDDFYIRATPRLTGLICNIMGTDCTNGGTTSGRKNVTLIGDGIRGPFEPSEDAPAVWLEYDLDPKGVRAGQLAVASVAWLRSIKGLRAGCTDFECIHDDWTSKHQIVRVVARPLKEDGTPRTGGMFGGNYIKTSDSRFPMSAPIPVHDRFE